MGKKVTSYESPDGRRHILVGNSRGDNEDVIDNKHLRTNRVGYRVLGGKAMFLGMLVVGGSRGGGLGEKLIEYFIKNVENNDGCEFEGTGLIHKPIISLLLARVGLAPEYKDFEGILLPRSNRRIKNEIPDIVVAKDEIDNRSRVVNGNGTEYFYREVDELTARFDYPLNAGKVINLHTWFQ